MVLRSADNKGGCLQNAILDKHTSSIANLVEYLSLCRIPANESPHENITYMHTHTHVSLCPPYSVLSAMSSYIMTTMWSSGTPWACSTWYAWHTSAYPRAETAEVKTRTHKTGTQNKPEGVVRTYLVAVVVPRVRPRHEQDPDASRVFAPQVVSG